MAADVLALTVVATVPGAALADGAGLVALRQQARTARRRYGVPADPPGPIDVVLRPRAGKPADARPVTVVGRGRTGARTCDVLAEQVPGLPAAADVIVLMVGTRDQVP